METKYFIVSSIDGDYAWLTEIGSSAEPVFFARALLPLDIDEGSKLKFENFQPASMPPECCWNPA